MLNIGGDQHDRSYRYKMSPLVTKIEGRGNGIKTVIVNIADVAKQLHINAAYPVKFFGFELGAQTKWSEAKERAVVNGAHQTKDMQAMLTKFIEQFILCPVCQLPEIKMKVKKRGITVDCAACGNNSALPGQHRLISYMIKHHQKLKQERDQKGGKKKKDKKHKKDKRGRVEQVQEEKKTEKRVEQVKEVEWFTDVSAEAQQKRKEVEFEQHDHSNPKVTAILAAAALENKEDSCSTLLQVFLAQEERSVREITSEVHRLKLAHNLDEPKAIKTLMESILDFSDIKSIPSQFAQHAALLTHFAQKNPAIFLGCIEELVGVIEPRLLARTPIILKELFDAEVLSDEDIIQWFELSVESSWLVNKRVAGQVRQRAEPLVAWLREASESDEESDEGDDDDEE